MLPRLRFVSVLAIAAAVGAAAPACFLASGPYDSAGVGEAGPGGAEGGTAGAATGGTSSAGGGDAGGTGGAGGAGGHVEGDLCPGIPVSISVYATPKLIDGDTTQATHDAGSDCGGGDAPELVYQVTPDAGGYLEVKLTELSPYQGVVYVRSKCDDPNSELGCGGDQPVIVPVQKGTPVFVFVDGDAAQPSGQFEISLYLDGCGNSVIEPDFEECDDGNILFADGCDSTCQMECECPGSGNCAAFEDMTTHHCYALITSPDASWAAAKQKCEDWGGMLASLPTQGELDAIEPNLSSSDGEIWIGASDLAVEGDYKWLDGSDWTYVDGQPPWESNAPFQNEPNGKTAENCIELYDYDMRLNDKDCTVTEDYLCERSPAGELAPAQ